MPLSNISLARLAAVEPHLAERIKQLDALAPELNIQVTQGLRTWNEQAALWAKGRDAAGNVIEQAAVVTDAPPGHSWHEFGLAVDIVPEEITPGEPDWNETHPAWQRINAFAPTVGLFEGNHYPGKFKDAPHLQPQEIPLSPTDADRQDFLEAGMSAVRAEYFPT